MEDTVLVRIIRDKIASGVLPRRAGPIWGGTGSGRRCAVCEDEILPTATEIELNSKHPRPLVFHPRCHAIYSEVAQAD